MKYCFILFLCCVFSVAQKADDIIRRHLENSGGVKNWNQLNAVYIEGQVVFGVEKAVNLRIYHRRPYLKRVVYVIEGKEVLSEGYDGKAGWTFSDQLNTNIRIPNYKPDAFENDLLNYKSKGFNVSLQPDKRINNVPCYAIRLKKNKNTVEYCFDKTNYDLIWEKNAEEELWYSDFKAFKNLRFATNIQAKTKTGGEYGIYFTKIVPNAAIDDKRFRFKR